MAVVWTYPQFPGYSDSFRQNFPITGKLSLRLKALESMFRVLLENVEMLFEICYHILYSGLSFCWEMIGDGK